MYTKSLIQQHLERINLLENFKCELNNIMDKFIIENSVFGLNRNGSAVEITTGYFIVEGKYNNLNDCIKSLKNNQFIQIKENSEFYTGILENSLMNCPEDKSVLDLDTLKYVR